MDKNRMTSRTQQTYYNSSSYEPFQLPNSLTLISFISHH